MHLDMSSTINIYYSIIIYIYIYTRKYTIEIGLLLLSWISMDQHCRTRVQ